MILYKFFAIAFLILTPIFAFIIHRFFSLKYLGLNFADLTFPLYFIEVVAVSARFFTHSFFAIHHDLAILGSYHYHNSDVKKDTIL